MQQPVRQNFGKINQMPRTRLKTGQAASQLHRADRKHYITRRLTLATNSSVNSIQDLHHRLPVRTWSCTILEMCVPIATSTGRRNLRLATYKFTYLLNFTRLCCVQSWYTLAAPCLRKSQYRSPWKKCRKICWIKGTALALHCRKAHAK